ncbi:MAG: 30S ribosomal protein S4 [Candidatus Buchananbacteria bacterium]
MPTKNTQSPQCKKCRRAGEKLFLKGEKCNGAKCTLVKRNFVPGVHGVSKRMAKLTNYGMQLKEKQKAKRTYGLREVQFRNYFEKAFRKVGNTGELLFRFLELRLDNTIHRLGFAPSRAMARQLVSHGHVTVNGKKVNIPSYQVKTGDIVGLGAKSSSIKPFASLKEDLKKSDGIVPWLSLNINELQGKVTSEPKLADVAVNVDWRTIVEFYSK